MSVKIAREGTTAGKVVLLDPRNFDSPTNNAPLESELATLTPAPERSSDPVALPGKLKPGLRFFFRFFDFLTFFDPETNRVSVLKNRNHG